MSEAKMIGETLRRLGILMDSGATMRKDGGKFVVAIWGQEFRGNTANWAIDNAWREARKGDTARARVHSIPPEAAQRINERIEFDRLKSMLAKCPVGWAVAS